MTIYKAIEALAVGDVLALDEITPSPTITSLDPNGIGLWMETPGIGIPMAVHKDDLRKMFPQGVPVIFEPNVIEGTVTIPPHGEPASMTIGQQTSLLMDMVRQKGKARVGDTYRVRWEQLPEVSK